MSEESVVRSHLPLTARFFHILLALAREPMNGYQLGLRIEEATGGALRLGPGTLYENLGRLLDRGLIREVEAGGRTDGRGQRFMTLTDLGLAVLRAEVGRLRTDVRAADGVPALREGKAGA